jgi:uncharacterized protein (TIGR00661 family)
MQSTAGNTLRILVAPLDWGLGHTTRCFPIVDALRNAGAEVILSGTEIQKAVFEKDFPDCKFLPLKGYRIFYGKNEKKFVWKMLIQLPKLLRVISHEHRWLKKIIREEKIDGVISDNRFGLHHAKIPCVFITHQLLIKNKCGNFIEKILQRINYKYINKFNTCWIPDNAETPNLAGALSHPKRMPKIDCTFIGILSRMKMLHEEKIKNHILIILSGPEPQRTLFEKIILNQLENFSGTATVVRGLPFEEKKIFQKNGINIYNHLPKEALNKEMCRAEYIICRSGYSSVMDFCAIGAKPILIPTPAQTEQEYLAEYLAQQNFCITVSQHDFDLMRLLNQARTTAFKNPFQKENNLLQTAVKKFIEECNERKNPNFQISQN